MVRPASPFETPVDSRAAFTTNTPAALQVFGGDTGSRRGSSNVLRSYETSPRIQAIFDLISETLAALPLRAYRAKTVGDKRRIFRDIHGAPASNNMGGETRRSMMQRFVDTKHLEEVPSPALKLLSSPMSPARPEMLSSWEWRTLINVQLELCGNAWLLALDRGSIASKLTRAPLELLPIPDPWVRQNQAGTFDIYGADGNVRWTQVHPSRMHWVRRPRPSNPFGRGIGKAQTLADEIDLDEGSARFMNSLLRNSGVPAHLVQVEHSTPEQREQLRIDLDQRMRGVQNAGRLVVTSGKVDIKAVGASPTDIGMAENRAFAADVMRESVGVPPEQMGQIKNSNRATVRESYKIFAQNVLLPRCRRWDDYYTGRVAPLFPDGDLIIIAHDSPLPADLEAEEVARGIAPWAMTRNQWLKQQGQDPVEGPTGELIMVPPNSQFIPESRLIELAQATIESVKNQNKAAVAQASNPGAKPKPKPAAKK